MIIHYRKIYSVNSWTRVSAIIECETAKELSTEIWFEVENRYKQFISPNMDSFLLSVLIMAMNLKEDIYVDGILSPRLNKRIDDIQSYFNAWEPNKLKKIKIRSKKTCEVKQKKKEIVSFFSGGVDSFFTLQNNVKNIEMNKKYQISKCIFLHGYDIPLKDQLTFDKGVKVYELFLKKLNIDLIKVKTNQREAHNKEVIWAWTCGTILTSSALLLSPLFSVVYIPASVSYGFLNQWGTNPITDELCSIENTNFIYHGADKRRMDKIKVISENVETYDKLRVCLSKPNGLENCCSCEKCIRTMIELEIVGKLKNYKTFKKTLKENIEKLEITTNSQRTFAQNILKEARFAGKTEIVNVIKRKLSSIKD